MYPYGSTFRNRESTDLPCDDEKFSSEKWEAKWKIFIDNLFKLCLDWFLWLFSGIYRRCHHKKTVHSSFISIHILLLPRTNPIIISCIIVTNWSKPCILGFIIELGFHAIIVNKNIYFQDLYRCRKFFVFISLEKIWSIH